MQNVDGIQFSCTGAHGVVANFAMILAVSKRTPQKKILGKINNTSIPSVRRYLQVNVLQVLFKLLWYTTG